MIMTRESIEFEKKIMQLYPVKWKKNGRVEFTFIQAWREHDNIITVLAMLRWSLSMIISYWEGINNESS